jgi:hypothetical protein
MRNLTESGAPVIEDPSNTLAKFWTDTLKASYQNPHERSLVADELRKFQDALKYPGSKRALRNPVRKAVNVHELKTQNCCPTRG